MPRYEYDDGIAGVPWWISALALGLGVLIVAVLIGSCSGLTRTGPTEVALIRNGGPLDSKDIRTVKPPEAAYSVNGMWSEVRKYIASNEQRFYTITTDPDRADNPSATFVEVPTKDGVQVKIEATTLFHTAFTGEDEDPLLREFDERFGNREFRESGSDDAKYVWDGNDGFSAFLDTIFRPVLVSTIREEIGGLNCADLVSSCALIQQGNNADGQPNLTGKTEDANESFQEVADAVQAKLATRVTSALGGPYLEDFSFQIARVELPENVQGAIDQAQSAFADIAQQRANAQAAKFEAERGEQLIKQYREAPALAQIEIARILSESDNGSTIILDSGSELGLNVKP